MIIGMKRFCASAVACCLVTGLAVLTASGQSTVSPQLIKTLQAIQKLNATDVLVISTWASYPRPQAPDPVLTAADAVEVAIVGLEPSEEEAVFAWLNHSGRGKLYTLGATDDDIGPCLPDVDPKCDAASPSSLAAAEPTGFRNLAFTLLPGAPDGGISIISGFAIVKTDSTLETHCLTFKNEGTKTADAVTFSYKIHAQSGDVVDAGSNVRTGFFSPGAQVAGPSSESDLHNDNVAGADKTPLQNCWTKSSPIATPALVRASYITVGVASVIYDDGTHWSP
jgi:hypothetical protein